MRKGYKQTEVGIIPDDWQVTTLAKVCQMKSGDSITSAGIDEFSKYPCYGGNGHRGFTSRFTHDGKYALIGRQGALCGNVLGVEGKFFASEHAIVVTASAKTDIQWLTYVLGEMRLNQYSESSAQPGLSVSKILSLGLALPPAKAEQEAIAEALSDADALIEAVEQLLTKKRQVKQGAMQELLTGKRRLSGFEKKSGYKQTEVGIIPEDWDAVSILEICDDKKGSIKIGPFGSQLKREYLVSSGYKVYGQENVYAQDVEIGDRYLTQEHFLKLKSCELLPGDFIVSMMGTIGQCMIVPDGIQQGIMDSHLIRIRLNPKVVAPRYMSYYYSSKLVFDQISRLQVGGIMAGLSSSVFKQIYIGLPNTTKEQTAIAEILSDMDAEITALEEKLVKARQVKAGMMSELLTGKIRLI